MCPVCLATTALIAGSIVSSGGLTALVWKKVATGKAAQDIPTSISANHTPKREDHYGQHDSR
jgi:hypothetical protein